MTDLADFLLARIAEDEAVARAAAEYDHRDNEGGHWHNDGGVLGPGKGPRSYSFDYIGEENAEHAARHDPARVLAECEAKRSVIAAAQAAAEEPIGKVWPPHVHMTGMADGLRMALGYLALPYADHPDYRQEWRP